MTSRKVLLLDRVTTLVLALLLGASGVLIIWWWTGGSPLPDRTDLTSISQVIDRPWWPWASAAIGVVLLLAGLRWTAAHLARHRVSRLTLPGTDVRGRLSLEGAKAVDSAAAAFADTLGVRSAKGVVNRDRGQLVAHVRAVIEPEVDLHRVARQAAEVSSSLAHVIGRDDLRCSFELTVARRGRSPRRVR